ncbi:hypothetical protein ABZT28_53535 [Streptomyces sp. NPDC005388]|uniref:hypothetical protein n=1 Tax=Streptomyces sp. NPDC005388 TaxID=3156717 RepID=UPI0033B47309
MTKSHGRKSRARSRSHRQGAAYTAANAGTLHVHASGPSATDLQPADPGRWGVEAVPDLRTAAALIGASIERCAPCRQSLTAKLLEEDPIVLAVTAGSVYSLHAAREPGAGGLAAKPTQVFFLLVQQARAHGRDIRMLRAGVERMTVADRAVLLDDALDLWTFYGRQHPGLIHGHQLPGPAARPDTAIAVPLDESSVIRAAAGRPEAGADSAELSVRHDGDAAGHRSASAVRTGPLPRHRPSVTRHPSKEDRLRMSENTEGVVRHAESAARSLAEFVTELQYRGTGIEYPVEASLIYRDLTRAAGEMTTALTLLRTSVEGLRDQDRPMTDYRGEPLGEVLQRYTDSSLAAEAYAGALGKALAVAEHPAYKEVPGGEQRPAVAARSLAELVTDLKYRGIGYPLEVYRIYSFLTRVAGEMRTALTLLRTSLEGLRDRELLGDETLDEAIQRYTGASVTAEQLAGVLGRAYSAVGHLAYKEAPSGQEPAVRG